MPETVSGSLERSFMVAKNTRASSRYEHTRRGFETACLELRRRAAEAHSQICRPGKFTDCPPCVACRFVCAWDNDVGRNRGAVNAR